MGGGPPPGTSRSTIQDRWFAANPGAGVSAKPPDFLKVFQKENLQPTWWERKTLAMVRLPRLGPPTCGQCPVVAYSGELDNQKQAADIMEPAMRKEGIELRQRDRAGDAACRFHPEGKGGKWRGG